MRSPLGFEPDICFEGAEKTCREWGINAFEELQEDEADRVPLREELIAGQKLKSAHLYLQIEVYDGAMKVRTLLS